MRAWDGVAFYDPLPHVERIARDDMPTGWSGVSLSRRLGRDSRPFQTSAYITICVRDSTGSKQGVGMGMARTNANGGRRCRQVQSVTAEKSAFRDASCCRGGVILTHGAGCRGRSAENWADMGGGVEWDAVGRRFGSGMAVSESDGESSRKVPFCGWNLKNGMKIGKDRAAKP